MTSKYLSTLIAILILHFGVSAQKTEFKLVNQFTDKHQIIPFTNYAIAFPDTGFKISEIRNGVFVYTQKDSPIAFEIMPMNLSENMWTEFIQPMTRLNKHKLLKNTGLHLKQKKRISIGDQSGAYMLAIMDSSKLSNRVLDKNIYYTQLVLGNDSLSLTIIIRLNELDYFNNYERIISTLNSLMIVPAPTLNDMADFPFNFEECNKSLQFSRYTFGMILFIPPAAQNAKLENEITLSVTPTITEMDYDTSFLKNIVISKFSFFDYEIVEIKLIEFNGYYGYQAYGKSDEGKLVFVFSYTKENQLIDGLGFADEYSQNNIDLFSNFIASIKSKN